MNSDDGFRLTSGLNPPANVGALYVNTPASLSGFKPTVQDTYLASYSLTNLVTGNLILVQANDVTITGLTLDGDNPTLTSGIVVGGEAVSAGAGRAPATFASLHTRSRRR